MTEKICSKCEETRSVVEFYRDKTRKDGFGIHCKLCVNAAHKEYRQLNSDKINSQRKLRGFDYPNKRYNQNQYRNTLKGKITAWKYSAKIRKISWNLTDMDLENIPVVCYYTGVELSLQSNQPNTISLDRLDSQKGYEPSNVVFCCEKVNKMKQDLRVEDFVELCRKVVAFNER